MSSPLSPIPASAIAPQWFDGFARNIEQQIRTQFNRLTDTLEDIVNNAVNAAFDAQATHPGGVDRKPYAGSQSPVQPSIEQDEDDGSLSIVVSPESPRPKRGTGRRLKMTPPSRSVARKRVRVQSPPEQSPPQPERTRPQQDDRRRIWRSPKARRRPRDPNALLLTRQQRLELDRELERQQDDATGVEGQEEMESPPRSKKQKVLQTTDDTGRRSEDNASRPKEERVKHSWSTQEVTVKQEVEEKAHGEVDPLNVLDSRVRTRKRRVL